MLEWTVAPVSLNSFCIKAILLAESYEINTSLNYIAMELIFFPREKISVFFYEQYQFGVTKRYLKMGLF